MSTRNFARILDGTILFTFLSTSLTLAQGRPNFNKTATAHSSPASGTSATKAIGPPSKDLISISAATPKALPLEDTTPRGKIRLS